MDVFLVGMALATLLGIFAANVAKESDQNEFMSSCDRRGEVTIDGKIYECKYLRDAK